MPLFKSFTGGLFFILSTLWGFSSAQAQAQNQEEPTYNLHQGFYLAGGVGANIVTSFEHEHAKHWKAGANLLAGYQFDESLAAEIGAMFSTAIFTDMSIWHVAVKGILPMGDSFSLFGKLGIAEADASLNLDFGHDFKITGVGHRAGLFLGAGMEYALTGNWGITLEYDGMLTSIKYKNDEGVKSRENALFGLLGLGLIYHF